MHVTETNPPSRRPSPWGWPVRLIAIAALAAAVGLAGIGGWDAQPVHGYKKPKYKKPNYTKVCRSYNCSVAKTCNVCATRDRKTKLRQCKHAAGQAAQECGPDTSCQISTRSAVTACKAAVNKRFKLDKAACRRGGNLCNRCCTKSKGQGLCEDYFSDSRFEGSRKYHGKVHCVDLYASQGPTRSGKPSPAFEAPLDHVLRSLGRLFPSLAPRSQSQCVD